MRILLPVDGSAQSDAAIAFIASRSALMGNSPEVRILNVQPPLPARAARMVGKAQVTGWYEDASAKVLKPALATLRKAGRQAQGVWAAGAPGDCIAAQAESYDADLIVMGAHGQSALRGLIMGSSTVATLAHTRRPVLLLRNGSTPKRDELRICIAVDGSRIGLQAVKYVLRHSTLFGLAPRLTVVHVVEDIAALAPDMAGLILPSVSDKDIQALQRKAFESAMAPVRLLMKGMKVQPKEVCLAGLAGDEIAALARKRSFDVLVLGTHGYGAFRAAVLGSVTTRVAAKCDTPLLLVR